MTVLSFSRNGKDISREGYIYLTWINSCYWCYDNDLFSHIEDIYSNLSDIYFCIMMIAYFQTGYRFITRLLQRALGQNLDHSMALHLYFDTGSDFNAQERLGELGDFTHQSTRCGDFITLCQRINHGAVLLLLLHLGADHHKVKNHKHQHQRQHTGER